jgi:DNA polymerase-3 subunit alpha
MRNENFCHLHVHSEFSQLDGMGTAKEYAAEAKHKKFKYLALTDHGNQDGLIQFQKECIENDIKPILGCEMYIVENLDKNKLRGHICVWVKNAEGYRNLCKMLTFANTDGFYYKPRVTYDYFLENCKGLCVSTACMISFARVLPNGMDFFNLLHKKLGEDFYCEVMPHDISHQVRWNKKIIRVAEKKRIKVIATNDCHYVKRWHWKAQEVLLAIQRKTTMDDPNRFKFSINGLHLRSAREMEKAFKINGHSFQSRFLSNTLEIAEKCSRFTIPKKDIALPRVPGVPINPSKAKAFLWDLCNDGYIKKCSPTRAPEGYVQNIAHDREYYERLKEEYDLIIKKKFERYIFMVWEVINWCKANNILVGPGRGSAGGSLMLYLLGITAVDPIKHKLLFSRFINEDRIDYPDIDIDFEDRKRRLVRMHLETVYGTDKVAGVSSFNRMKAKAVMKDVGRAFKIPWQETEVFTKLIEDNDDHTGIQDAIEAYPECRDYAEKYPKVVKFAKQLEGQVRGYGQHAAALVISKEEIGTSGRCNLRLQEELSIVNWEKDDTEYVGLMKLDALSLKLLSILSETKKLIKQNHNVDIDFEHDIDMNDKSVFNQINDGKNVGVFQFGTYAMSALIEEMGIQNFGHMSDAVALVRPGPANSGMTEQYIKRKHGESWDPMHEIYENITKDTYGVIAYQEQVMQVISEIAGLPYSTADKIRKIIGKKRNVHEFEKYRAAFLEGCNKTGYFSHEEAIRFWAGLEKHAKYSFNRSHSVEYAVVAYWCAWLKKYYPTEFICASLTYGAEAKKKDLIEEAYKLGLRIMLPKVNKSDARKWKAFHGKLYIPFNEVKGIGDTRAIEASNGPQINENGIDKWFGKKIKRKRPPAKIGGMFGELLDLIGAYDENNPEITNEIKKLFNFRIVTNPKSEYKKLYQVFNNDLSLNRLDAALEGDNKILRELVKKNSPLCRTKFSGHKKLIQCEKCELIDECKAPIGPSPGRYNVAIVGEAPGPIEDKDRELLVGKSGRKIWASLKPYKRELFHITNVVKCHPSKSRKPTPNQIKMCSSWLDKELKMIQPILILSFGNTGLQFFRNQNSGITGMSGKVLWNEHYGAWIVYCLHPAAAMHNPDNMVYYKNGMKRFKQLLRIFSV